MRLYHYCLLLSGWLTAPAWGTDTVKLYMPEAPPLTFQQYQNGYGIAGDMALLAIIRAGMLGEIVNGPWARVQMTVAEGKNLLVTPLSRTPEREDKYTWIAPIMSLERAFFTLGTPVSNFDDARKRYNRIAVGLGSAQEDTLTREGFSAEQIVSIKLGEIPTQLLERGRVDAWFTGIPEALYLWPVNSPALKMSPVLDASDLYLACSKDCDPNIVQRLQKAIEELKQEGHLDKIKKVYLPGL